MGRKEGLVGAFKPRKQSGREEGEAAMLLVENVPRVFLRI